MVDQVVPSAVDACDMFHSVALSITIIDNTNAHMLMEGRPWEFGMSVPRNVASHGCSPAPNNKHNNYINS